MKTRVLLTDTRYPSIEEEEKVLLPHGIEIDTTFSSNEDELIEHGRGAAGFLVSYAQVTRKVMQALPELKVIVKYGVGVDNIDLKAAAELKKYVANVPDYCVEEVAQQALSLILDGVRRTSWFSQLVRQGVWAEQNEKELPYRPSRLTAGLLGFGRIARQLARYLQPLVKQVCFFDPFVAATPAGFEFCRKLASLEELFSQCTIVSVHAPLTEATRGIVNDACLAGARNAILVNTSRGGLVDRGAVERALDDGRLRFFGSDVFWKEPPDFKDAGIQSLVARPNAVFTPHVGFCSRYSVLEMRRKAAEEVLRVLQGGKPKNSLANF
jgi:D-3-phosphoglycerate dehydrogenase